MMFKRKKKTGVQTPKFRKPTVPPQPSVPPMPPTSVSNAFKPNPNYVPPASVKKPCTYETPCGWCTKWDKKCDNKIELDIVPLLSMPDHAAECIMKDMKNKIYEFSGVPENLIKEN